MSLTSSEKAQYSAIIDEILASGDLQTISAKQIRKGLQSQLEIDISDKKKEVQALILERFDHASSSTTELPPSSAPESYKNGGHVVKKESKVKYESPQSYPPSPDPHEDDSDDAASPKKKRKQGEDQDDDEDAKFAARLQAQENSKSRPTRGGTEKRRVSKSTAKLKKRKSAVKVKKSDDSDLDLESNGEAKEKPKKGGFHKQYHLSESLSHLVGDPTLSRPQVVKKIWEHIKAEGLQEPTDKRQIRCDEKMRLVFKQDQVHMFTMNKLLGKHLFEVEE